MPIDPGTATIVAAGSQLLGGILGNKSKSKSNSKQLKFAKEQFNFQRNHARDVLRHQVNQWHTARADTQFQRDQDYNRQKEFAQNSAGWQLQDIFDTADASGIHRLAAIGGANAAQYSGAVSVGSPVSGSSAGSVGYSPESSDYSFIGDAAGTLLQASLAKADSDRADKLTNAQVKSLEADAYNSVKQADAATSRTQIRNARDLAQTLSTDSQYKDGKTDVAGQTMVGNLAVGGDTIEPDRRMSDAEIIEGRYGDVVSWLYGLGTLSADAVKHLKKVTGEDDTDRAILEFVKQRSGWKKKVISDIKQLPRTKYKDDQKAMRTRGSNSRWY